MIKFLLILYFNCMKFFCYIKQENESLVFLLGFIVVGKDVESMLVFIKILDEEMVFEIFGGSFYLLLFEVILDIICMLVFWV